MFKKIKYIWQRITRGWSDKDCWNLDYNLVKWINSHIKVLYRDGSKIIDWSYNKHKYKKKEYSDEELFLKLIDITDKLMEFYNNEIETDKIKEIDNLKNEMYDILKIMHWHLWW